MRSAEITRVYVCSVVGIVALFLGWLPKMGADGVPWFLDNDFAHLYLTGTLVGQGINPYAVDLSPLYAEYGFTPTREIPFAGAPPTLAVIMSLFSFLSPWSAYLAWTSVQVSALVLGALMCMRMVGLRWTVLQTAVVVCGVLAPLGVFAHIRYGQTQALMFFLVALGLFLVQREERWMGRVGLVLWGISASLKLFTAPLIFVAWRYRGREGALWFLVGFGLLCAPLALWCGVSSLQTFVCQTIPYIQDLSIAFNGNISLAGAVTYTQRILFGQEVLSARLVQIVCMVGFVPLVTLEVRDKRDLIAATVTCIAACCLLSPTTWTHYLPLLTGGFIYLVARARSAARPSVALWCILGLYMCLGVALGYIARGDVVTQLVSAWWGALGMIGMIVMITLARRRVGVFA